jgi:hypothetical protein
VVSEMDTTVSRTVRRGRLCTVAPPQLGAGQRAPSGELDPCDLGPIRARPPSAAPRGPQCPLSWPHGSVVCDRAVRCPAVASARDWASASAVSRSS